MKKSSQTATSPGLYPCPDEQQLELIIPEVLKLYDRDNFTLSNNLASGGLKWDIPNSMFFCDIKVGANAVCKGESVRSAFDKDNLSAELASTPKSIKAFNVVSHGGEPLLLGPKYMDEMYKIFSNNVDTNVVKFSIQTNATLINENFIKIFLDNNIHLGISLDGDFDANKHRIDHQGRETWSRTIKGINIVKEHADHLFSGILSVIDFNSNPTKILETFTKLEVRMVDFLLPFYTHDSLITNQKKNLQVLSNKWFNDLFKIWTENQKYHPIKIRIFEDAIQSIITKIPKTDWFGQNSISYL